MRYAAAKMPSRPTIVLSDVEIQALDTYRTAYRAEREALHEYEVCPVNHPSRARLLKRAEKATEASDAALSDLDQAIA